MLMLEKRFGMHAIENGFITKDQLHKSLVIQVEGNIEGKTHKLIGNILMDLGYINSDQVNKILLSLKID